MKTFSTVSIVFGVPPDLPVGDYQLMVRTPGNTDWAPATAR